jgi:AAA domain (dynein-related subfamily)
LDFKSFIQCAQRLPANVSVLLRGPHGIGKSQGVFQLGAHFDLSVIDKRLSQMSEGDMIGLPKVEGGVTKFLPPDWYMDACNNARVLFLDELNRATPEVMQAAFQVVLDRQLNGHRLHPNTRVYAAINNSGAYQVNEMDPALLDRFWTVDLKPTVEDWLEWAKPRVHPNLYDFVLANQKFLDPVGKDSNAIEPSRRSYERLDATLVAANLMDHPEDPMFYSLSRGFIGNEASIKLTDFVKNMDKQISAEDILNKFDKVKTKISKLGQEKWNICIEKIDEYVQKNGITDAQGKNLGAFCDIIPQELVIVVWAKCVAPGPEKMDQVRTVHKYLGKKILSIFDANPDAAFLNKKEDDKTKAKK